MEHKYKNYMNSWYFYYCRVTLQLSRKVFSITSQILKGIILSILVSKFWLLPLDRGEESEKLKKGVEVWCRERSLFLFNFFKFIISTFTNYFTLSKTVLCIWRKFISATIILWKKVILSCLKMNLEISHK